MEREENVSWWDRKNLWLEKKKPSQSRHALTGATYELKDVGPFAIDLSGAPIYKKTTFVLTLIFCYLVYWFWYGWVNTGVINYVLLEQMTWGALLGGMGFVIVLFSMVIDYHKGSFAPYKRILEMRIRTLSRKKLKRCEFKVLDHTELYNPVSGGYWRSEDHIEDIQEADDKEDEEKPEKKGKKETPEKRTKQDIIDELPKEIHKRIGIKKLKKMTLAKLENLAEKFEPVDVEDDDMPFYLLEGKRFHSVRDMKRIMDIALGRGEVIQTKDEIKTVLNLKRRFVDLAEKLRLPFVCTLCECDTKGGKIFPLFISDHSLFGGSSSRGSYVEFREHTLAQRTWAALMSKDNVRAGVGEGIEIGMYRFYELVPDEFALLGKKEERMKFAPVIFVTASDAQAEKMMADFRYNKIRKGTVQQDLIDASVIYDSSIADELFELNKLVVGRLKRKEKSEKERQDDSDWEVKDTVAKAVEKSLIIETAGKGGMFRNIHLFSHKSVKYFFYFLGIIGICLTILYIVHYYGGINIGWLFDRMPTNGTAPITDPWG